MQRNIRKQTATEKRIADRKLIENGITMTQNFLAKFPDDPYAEARKRQMAMLQDKLQGMTN